MGFVEGDSIECLFQSIKEKFERKFDEMTQTTDNSN